MKTYKTQPAARQLEPTLWPLPILFNLGHPVRSVLPSLAPSKPSAISTFQSREPQKALQFQHFNSPPPKIPRHFNISPEEISPTRLCPIRPIRPICPIGHIPSLQLRPNSILETLSPSAIETLLSWCEDHPYAEVKKLAARPPAEGGLGLNISASTLCRRHTNQGIADSKEARAQYARSLGLDGGARLLPSRITRNDNPQSILNAAQDQLELRVLELASLPNPSFAELRLLSQTIARLRSLQLGERRVQVAEKREARMATPPPQSQKPRILSAAEIKHRVRVLLGKESPRGCDEADFNEKRHSQNSTPPDYSAPSRNVTSFPEAPPNT